MILWKMCWDIFAWERREVTDVVVSDQKKGEAISTDEIIALSTLKREQFGWCVCPSYWLGPASWVAGRPIASMLNQYRPDWDPMTQSDTQILRYSPGLLSNISSIIIVLLSTQLTALYSLARLENIFFLYIINFSVQSL